MMPNDPIPAAIDRLNELTAGGPLTEDALREAVFPLFSRVLKRDEIYLANHSLGRPLDRMADDVRAALDLWYTDMDHAWGGWMEAQNRYRGLVARLIGCDRPDAVVPKTSAGQGVRAVLNALPTARPGVVTTTGEFDSTDFILKSYEQRDRATVTRVPARSDGVFHAEDIAAAITEDTDMVAVSHVIFATGQVVAGIEQVVRRAHECNAVVLIDTYHSAGVFPVSFDDLGADFAVGGNYKYTRGGPGACWLAIHQRHLDDRAHGDGRPLVTLDTGWFAKREPFGFRRSEQPLRGPGGDAWLESTPPFLLPYQAMAGLEFTLAVGLDRLRAYSQQQQAELIDLLRAQGVEPHLFEPRGAYVLIPTADGHAMSAELKRRGVNTDARSCPTTGTGFVRLCPDVLTTRDEMAKAAAIFGDVMRQ